MVMEHIFLGIYTAEFFMRLISMGLACLEDNWVKFDLLLVISGFVDIFLHIAMEGDSLGPVMVLRMGRLLRLARTVRMLVKIQVLWMLVRGLLMSAGTML